MVKINSLNQIKSIFPFEKNILAIDKKKISATSRQFMIMASNLTPALVSSELTSSLKFSPFLGAPISISTMHLTNRGTGQLPKLFLNSFSSVSVLGLQKFLSLPKFLIRPILAAAIFFVEHFGDSLSRKSKEKLPVLNKKEEKHEHHSHCNHSHEDKHEHVHGTHCNHDHSKTHVHSEKLHSSSSSEKKKEAQPNDLTKELGLKLLRLEALINTVPIAINYLTEKINDFFNESSNVFTKFLGHTGSSIFKTSGISAGFIGLGYLFDYSATKLNLKPHSHTHGHNHTQNHNHSHNNHTHDKHEARVEAVEEGVCACHSSVVCPEALTESTTEAASESSVFSVSEFNGEHLTEKLGSIAGNLLLTGFIGLKIASGDPGKKEIKHDHKH